MQNGSRYYIARVREQHTLAEWSYGSKVMFSDFSQLKTLPESISASKLLISSGTWFLINSHELKMPYSYQRLRQNTSITNPPLRWTPITNGSTESRIGFGRALMRCILYMNRLSNATKLIVLLTSGRSFRDKILFILAFILAFILGDNKVSITLIIYISLMKTIWRCNSCLQSRSGNNMLTNQPQ